MKTYTERIFEELVQDNSTEAKLKRYLERRRMEHEEFENNRPRPKSKRELQDIIVDAIKENGPEVNLNYIDVSGINDMRELFNSYHDGVDENKDEILQSFNGDISDWDVSSVEDMSCMFQGAKDFNQDISDWDVSIVEDMWCMFWGAKNFNQNISGWKVGSVKNMSSMFYNATSFDQDLSGWDVTGKDVKNMFDNCPIREDFKPKGLYTKGLK